MCIQITTDVYTLCTGTTILLQPLMLHQCNEAYGEFHIVHEALSISVLFHQPLARGTLTGWNRLSSAGSFSICFRYSSSVVAPIH
ncbi:hypothetical protein HanRHA438_Chr02g0052581 [Helianthus annuus]|nr:hypothetical protein HanRHA438_Chr02g0052581 [Helianthus annuus]